MGVLINRACSPGGTDNEKQERRLPGQRRRPGKLTVFFAFLLDGDYFLLDVVLCFFILFCFGNSSRAVSAISQPSVRLAGGDGRLEPRARKDGA